MGKPSPEKREGVEVRDEDGTTGPRRRDDALASGPAAPAEMEAVEVGDVGEEAGSWCGSSPQASSGVGQSRGAVCGDRGGSPQASS